MISPPSSSSGSFQTLPLPTLVSLCSVRSVTIGSRPRCLARHFAVTLSCFRLSRASLLSRFPYLFRCPAFELLFLHRWYSSLRISRSTLFAIASTLFSIVRYCLISSPNCSTSSISMIFRFRFCHFSSSSPSARRWCVLPFLLLFIVDSGLAFFVFSPGLEPAFPRWGPFLFLFFNAQPPLLIELVFPAVLFLLLHLLLSVSFAARSVSYPPLPGDATRG